MTDYTHIPLKPVAYVLVKYKFVGRMKPRKVSE